MLIARLSPVDGEPRFMEIDITHKQLEMYDRGVPIHDAMPNTTFCERQFIQYGTLPSDYEPEDSESW